MRRMTPQQIRDEFNQKREKFAAWGKETGFDTALQDISRALRDMQDSGIDVRLDIMGTASEMAFSQLPQAGITTPISGILHINNIQYLLSLSVKHNGKNCLKLAVSEFDIRHQGVAGTVRDEKLRANVRSSVFDLKNDADALVKFQEYVINQSARNSVIAENDAANAMNTGIPDKKPVLKLHRNK